GMYFMRSGAAAQEKSHGAAAPWLVASSRGGAALTPGALRRSLDDREDVLLGHDQQVLAVHAALVAGVGGEQPPVALLDLQRGTPAVLQQLAVADAQHFALLGLLLGGVGQQDAARRLLFRLEALDHD